MGITTHARKSRQRLPGPRMRSLSARRDVRGIRFRDSERRSPSFVLRSEPLCNGAGDLTCARKVGSKRWGGLYALRAFCYRRAGAVSEMCCARIEGKMLHLPTNHRT
jgi:hypothetical protein